MIRQKIDNPRFPHLILISRHDYADDPFEEGETIVVLYKGVGHSYTDTTTNGDEKVDTSKRKASIPVRFDEWTAEREVHDGDIIAVMRGNLFEQGVVRDWEPDNDRTVIYWELQKA